jgi:hypothetical protein
VLASDLYGAGAAYAWRSQREQKCWESSEPHRTLSHVDNCSVATTQGSDATCACLGAVVLAVSLASLQRCATCCCYARDARSTQRRILLALRDAYDAKTLQ